MDECLIVVESSDDPTLRGYTTGEWKEFRHTVYVRSERANRWHLQVEDSEAALTAPMTDFHLEDGEPQSLRANEIPNGHTVVEVPDE